MLAPSAGAARLNAIATTLRCGALQCRCMATSTHAPLRDGTTSPTAEPEQVRRKEVGPVMTAVAPAELAALLRTRQRNRLLQANELAASTRARVASVLIEFELSQRVWLIGSLAWGDFDESADVDLVIEGATEEELAQLWHRFERELKRSVDLLRFEDLPGEFRSRVLSEGIRLHVT